MGARSARLAPRRTCAWGRRASPRTWRALLRRRWVPLSALPGKQPKPPKPSGHSLSTCYCARNDLQTPGGGRTVAQGAPGKARKRAPAMRAALRQRLG